jgi:hypothetical protein
MVSGVLALKNDPWYGAALAVLASVVPTTAIAATTRIAERNMVVLLD